MPDGKVTDGTLKTTWVGADILYLIHAAQDCYISVANFFADIPVLAKFSGRIGLGTDHQTLVNSGTIDVTKTITRISNDQPSTVIVPAGSFDGQIKILLLTSAVGATTLSGTFGNTSIVLGSAGSTATLLYTQSKWWYVGGNATVS